MSYFAVIDVGSNSVRLVVCMQKNCGSLEEVQNVKMNLRLRNYLNKESILIEEGLSLLLKVIKGFKEIIDTYDVEELICASTATIRQARNKQKVIDSVKKETGYTLQVLTGEEEAFYGYLAVVNSTRLNEGITIDIGGGSTEVTYFQNRLLQHTYSFSFGALTLKKFFENNQSNEQNLSELRTFLFNQFNKLDWLKGNDAPIIGIGGSARNLVKISKKQKGSPIAGIHQYEMSNCDFIQVFNLLSNLDKANMKKVEGLSEDRTDSILPAIEAIYCLFKLTEADTFIYSRKGLREGIFYKRLTKGLEYNLFPNVLKNSMQKIIDDYYLNEDHIRHMSNMTAIFFEQLKTCEIDMFSKIDLEWIQLACTVFELGNYIDRESSATHTFYMITNRAIDGMSHKDRLRLASIASYKNKTLFKQLLSPYKDWFTKEDRKQLLSQGIILRFMYNLNATKRQVVRDIKIKEEDGQLVFLIKCNAGFIAESCLAEKQKKQLEKLLSIPIKLKFYKE